MTKKQDGTIATAYGLVDRTALIELEDTYDTRSLLVAVDELGQLAIALTGPNSLRDTLLELHGMAHTVINGVGISVPTDNERLPEVAACAISDIDTMISTLRRIAKQIEPLANLATHD